MNLQDVMLELEQAGTEWNRKIYCRHGAPDNQFGVPWSVLNALQKRLKRNQLLADELWATGNADARILAAMIADPEKIKKTTLDKWVKECTYKVPAGTIASHTASKTPYAWERALKWMDSKHEWTSMCGWQMIGILAVTLPAAGGHPDEDFAPLIERITAEIHSAPNMTRDAMNMTLIAIGGYRAGLRETAIVAAKRIGKVKVDHGATNCQTPDAVGYIEKMVKRG